jgi:hypothetical protein
MKDKPLPTTTESLILLSAVGIGALLTLKWYTRKTEKHKIPDTLQKSPYGLHVQVAVQLALQAGANMVAYCDEKGTAAEDDHDLGIATKGAPEDFCTKVDVENERKIIQGLLNHFPSHQIIGEETTGTGAIPPLTSAETWIIDPVDGTHAPVSNSSPNEKQRLI